MKQQPSVPSHVISNELLSDPETAAFYLEECLASGDTALFKLALRNVASARLGSMAALSRKANLAEKSLYRSLSENGNPKLETLTKILDATGLRLSVTPVDTAQ